MSNDLAFNGVDQLYAYLKDLFPDFLTDLHSYMHATALNGHIRKKETMLKSFLIAQSSILIKNQLYIDPLLKACKIIAFFLAKVTVESATKKVRFEPLEKIRKDILLKIQALENSKNSNGWELVTDVPSDHRSIVTTLAWSMILFADFLRNLMPGIQLDVGEDTLNAAILALKPLNLIRTDHVKQRKKISSLLLPDRWMVLRILGADAMTQSELTETVSMMSNHDVSTALKHFVAN